MEIAPISGIRVMPVAKTPPANPSLSGVFDISMSRAGSDTYSGNDKSTGGQDDEENHQDAQDDDEDHPNRSMRGPSGGISIFA